MNIIFYFLGCLHGPATWGHVVLFFCLESCAAVLGISKPEVMSDEHNQRPSSEIDEN